jgi:hypothetical protein
MTKNDTATALASVPAAPAAPAAPSSRLLPTPAGSQAAQDAADLLALARQAEIDPSAAVRVQIGGAVVTTTAGAYMRAHCKALSKLVATDMSRK